MQYILYYKYRQKSLEGRRRIFFVLCRVPLYNTRQMNKLPSVRILTPGKQNICRVLHSRLTAKLISVRASSAAGVTWGAHAIFAECPAVNTRQNTVLPCAFCGALGKQDICRVFLFCRVSFLLHTVYCLFAECARYCARQTR